MGTEEKEDIRQIRKDFYKIKKDSKLSDAEIDDIMADITKLLGILAIERDDELAALLEEMISFAEDNNLMVEGSKFELEAIRKGKIRID